jgi:hypothetical protein
VTVQGGTNACSEARAFAETPSFSDANYRHMLSGERISQSKHVPFFVTVNKLCAQRLDDIHEPHAHPQPSQHGTTHTLRYLSGPHTHTQRKESLASTRSNTLHTRPAPVTHTRRVQPPKSCAAPTSGEAEGPGTPHQILAHRTAASTRAKGVDVAHGGFDLRGCHRPQRLAA